MRNNTKRLPYKRANLVLLMQMIQVLKARFLTAQVVSKKSLLHFGDSPVFHIHCVTLKFSKCEK